MSTDLVALCARLRRAFNDRDFDVWRELYDDDVELLVDGMPFRGVDAAVGYGVASASQFPGLSIASERIVAESGDTIVSEITLVNGDPVGGQMRNQGTVLEIFRVRDGRIVSVRSYYMPEPAGRADAVRVPARGEAGVVGEEQAALRRVAMLVARGVSEDEVFAAVTEETGWLVNADTTSLMRFEPDDTVTLVAAWSARQADLPLGSSRPVDDALRSMRETGHPWRRGPADLPPTGPFVEEARALGMHTFVGVPVVVDGRIWGAIFVSSTADRPFADDAEARLTGFTELVGTAIANAHARGELRSFADEQAALRRVATLVATGAPPAEVFTAVAAEIGRLLRVDYTVLIRSDPGETITVAGTWTGTGAAAPSPVGSRFEVGGRNVTSEVLRTRRPVRMDAYADVSGAIGNTGRREWGFRSSVGAPISVEGRLWGLILVAYTRDEALPADTEARLAGFIELVATAIANAQARVELHGHAEEQAALRRVATLVARAAGPEEVFAAVAAEVGARWSSDATLLSRYDADGATIVGAWSSTDALPIPVGTRVQIGGRNVATLVFQTRGPARIDDYADATGLVADVADASGIRSAVGAPISVEDRLWGVMSVVSIRDEPLPADTELRLAGFTELVATAIANTQARVELRGFADTQSALRRLATLVARGEAPEVVFAAATREARLHFGGGTARLIRFEPDGTETLLANEGTESHVRIGERWEGYPPTGLTVTVRRTGRAGRVDDYRDVPGSEVRLREGILSSVAVPIYVNGRLWGMIAVGSGQAPLPHDTEQRMAGFTDLVATAVANAQNRSELITSRARIIAASDEARRRIERDLHDGAQQHLVALALRLRSASAPHHSTEFGAEVMDVAADLLDVIDELREICRGIHPGILSSAGLRSALHALVRRSAVPVDLDVRIDGRLPEPVEVGAYYVVSEMLTNAAKHARASVVEVTVEVCGGMLRVYVRDDGVGGADPVRGSGLVGLKDRTEALGGTFSVHSPAGVGTTVTCELPVSEQPDPEQGK